jgi:hypothetical protein
MRHFWIKEVRYYKYILVLSIFLIFSGYLLLTEFYEKEKNIGIIVNVYIIQNVSYIIPVYKVKKDNIIYNMYDSCILQNVTNCKNLNYNINILVHFEKINGNYIIIENNNFLFYFGIFAISIAIIVMSAVSFAYYEYFRIRNLENIVWSKQKKLDIDVEKYKNFESILFY